MKTKDTSSINWVCARIQSSLSRHTPTLPLSAECEQHLSSCSQCKHFYESLKAVDSSAGELPGEDAPDILVDTLLKKIKAEKLYAPASEKSSAIHGAKTWMLTHRKTAILLPIAVCLVFITLRFNLAPERAADTLAALHTDVPIYHEGRIQGSFNRALTYLAGSFGALLMVGSFLLMIACAIRSNFRLAGSFASLAICCFVLRSFTSTFFNTGGNAIIESEVPYYNDSRIGDNGFWSAPSSREVQKPAPQIAPLPKQENAGELDEFSRLAKERRGAVYVNEPLFLSHYAMGATDPLALEAQRALNDASDPGNRNFWADPARQLSIVRSQAQETAGRPTESETRNKVFEAKSAEVFHHLLEEMADGQGTTAAAKAAAESAPRATTFSNSWLRLLQKQSEIRQAQIQPAQGYWENTYIPGDVEIAILANKLKADARFASTLDALLKSRNSTQALDAPKDTALALYAAGAQASVNGPARTLIQVSIAGADYHSTSRPPLRLELLVDTHSFKSAEQKALLKSTLEAFSKAQLAGDKIGLVAAESKSTGLALGDFRYGELSLVLSDLFNTQLKGAEEQTLLQAFERASKNLRDDRANEDLLGNKSVILLTADSLGYIATALAQRAHESALQGVTLSTIGIGQHANAQELAGVAAFGQGSRRIVLDSSAAPSAVQREIDAQCRVVARALRINVALAHGVQLVDVLGAKRLDGVTTSQVKAAENAIDKNVAKRLGVESDRGGDNEGIQILIPAFYSADVHSILLDVVVPGPGKVADVTLKYKDIAHLKNESAHMQLTLGSGNDLQTPRQVDVQKTFLLFQLAQSLNRAAASMESSNPAAALSELANAKQLVLDFEKATSTTAANMSTKAQVSMLDSLVQGYQQSGNSSAYAEALKVAGYLQTTANPIFTNE